MNSELHEMDFTTYTQSGWNRQKPEDMDTCDMECSACLLYDHHSTYLSAYSLMSNSTTQTTQTDYGYLSPLKVPYKLRDFLAVAGPRRPDMDPLPSPPRSEEAASKLIETFWESYETSILCCTEHVECFRQGHSEVDKHFYNPLLQYPDPTGTNNHYATENIYTELSSVTKQRDNCLRSKDTCKATDSKRQPLVHQLTEFCARRLSKRGKKSKAEGEAERIPKRCKKRKRFEKKNIKLFGPDFEEREEDKPIDLDCVSDLLQQLNSEVTSLKCHGTELTNQMWLLYSKFEEFLRARYPETAAGIKRYVKASDWTTQCTRDLTRHHERTYQNETEIHSRVEETESWIEEASLLHTSVAETRDWLRPSEECDDWSDDTDRVRKLIKSEENTVDDIQSPNITLDENCNNLGKDTIDCMNISWYTKVKKIDKSSSRSYRNRSRTPDKRGRHQRHQSVEEPSIEIRTPVRRPEDLFRDSCVASTVKKSANERVSRRDILRAAHRNAVSDENHNLVTRPDSRVTISSGYESDRDVIAEADSILYGHLPGLRNNSSHMENNKSTPYPDMAELTHEKTYQNISKSCRFARVPVGKSLEDLSCIIRNDSHVTLSDDSQSCLNRSKSMEDVLNNDRPNVFKIPHLRQSGSQQSVLSNKNSKVCEFKARRSVCFDEFENVVSYKSHQTPNARKSSNVDSDSDDEGNSCAYENVPAALYAQVSPPKPCQVYKTPTQLSANPLWESTPMDEKHKPRIRNLSGHSDMSNSQAESSLRAQMRKKAGLLLEDKSASITPYKSAFRPYNKEVCIPTPSGMQQKLQEHSIAELRRVNGQLLNNHYLCMSRSRSMSMDSTVASVLVDDVTLRPASLGQTLSQCQNAKSVTETELSPDSGRGSTGNSDHGSPTADELDVTVQLRGGFKNLKDSCVVHKDKLEKSVADEDDYTLNDSQDLDSSNVYETIPCDSEIKRHLEDTTFRSEHVYCRIGDIPTMIENASSFCVPEPPPVKGRCSLSGAVKEVKSTDVIKTDRFHTYTVADIMQSSQQYAAHLTNGASSQHTSANKIEIVTANPVSGGSKTKKPTFMNKYRKQSSGKNQQTKELSKKSITTKEQCDQSKNNVCNFTPGFTQVAPGTSGALYSGRGTKLAAIKKTLSFQDLSPSSPDREQKKAGYHRHKSVPKDQSFTPVLNNHTRPRSAIQHRRFASDFTPTVIDGAQSYLSTPTDVTTELILSPPSAFKSYQSSANSSPGDETPVYENIKDMQIMREKRQKALDEGRAIRLTPLRRTQSAMQIHWGGLSESREIFC